jgi:transposase
MDAPSDPSAADESARTTNRRSARNTRVEIITRGEGRRRWTSEQKREIVAESLGPDLTPTEVARKYAITTGQLYTWRQQFLTVPGALITRAVPRFAEVELATLPSPPIAPATPSTAPSSPSEPSPPPDGLIEIALPGGIVVRVDAHVDGAALGRVLKALDAR